MPVNPKILTIPFARDASPGLVNAIPDDPVMGEPQKASWKQGFQSETMIPLTAGGIPPEGQDFNGVLKDITEHIVYQNGGGQYAWSQEWVDEHGGYPQGAVLSANDGLSLWVSLEDDNTEDFNTGTPSKWARIAFSGLDTLLLQGAASWSADGAPYPLNAQVYHNGKQWLARRANSVPPAEGADWTELVGKKYIDAAGYLQPSMTGSATLNGTTDNTVQLTDIVTTLGLEVGDVIRIQYSGYDKLHTVESITNNNLIVVNYEHAGNRGNGSLKLADETAIVTITRLSKWHNAPVGLGQASVDVSGFREKSVNYINGTNRSVAISIDFGESPNLRTLYSNGFPVSKRKGYLADQAPGNAVITSTLESIIEIGAEYSAVSTLDLAGWLEVR